MELSTRSIARKCGVSNATVSRIGKTFNTDNRPASTPTKRLGRPAKITDRMSRQLIRTLKKIRSNSGGNFSSKKIALEAGIPSTVSNRTVRRALNKSQFHWLQARKKGLMTVKDYSKRITFARMITRDYPADDLWKDKIAFYFDGVSFIHKTRPLDQALAPRGRVWRMRCEGLDHGCTAKGSSCLSGGRRVKVFVAISFGKGVILAESYVHLNGPMFADFVTNSFPGTFIRSGKDTNLFLQDGDPSQNSAHARAVFNELGYECFKIPPRSPDINPIENLFHLVKKKLNDDAIERNIIFENYEDFQYRVLNTLRSFDIQIINNIISSMGKRIINIKERKGQRLKY